jgi:hypothetical protein
LLVGLNSTGGTDIFTDYSSYTVKLNIYVDYYKASSGFTGYFSRTVTYPISFIVSVGYTSSNFLLLTTLGLNTLPKHILQMKYYTRTSGTNKTFTLQKVSSVP